MRAGFAERDQAVHSACEAVCREGESPVRRVEADFEVVGLVYVSLTLCGGGQPGRMGLSDEDTLSDGRTLRVQRDGAGGRGQCRIRGGQVRVHEDRWDESECCQGEGTSHTCAGRDLWVEATRQETCKVSRASVVSWPSHDFHVIFFCHTLREGGSAAFQWALWRQFARDVLGSALALPLPCLKLEVETNADDGLVSIKSVRAPG